MKMAGIEVQAKYIKDVTFSRPDKDFVFKLEAVGDYHDFEVDHPQPEPPVKQKGKINYRDRDDPDYIEFVEEWSGWRIHWMVIQTIKGVEWETVTSDPDTFENWEQDMRSAGFSQIEISKLQNEILVVNGLLETERIEEAVKNSLAGKEAEAVV